MNFIILKIQVFDALEFFLMKLFLPKDWLEHSDKYSIYAMIFIFGSNPKKDCFRPIGTLRCLEQSEILL